MRGGGARGAAARRGEAMSEPFQAGYSAYYDLLYRDKDYAAEARFVAELVRRHGGRPPAGVELLDLACGTGRHLIELARLGMVVAGGGPPGAPLPPAGPHPPPAGGPGAPPPPPLPAPPPH